MNREIKFRAWDKPNNKMVSHRYLEHHKSGFRLFQNDEFELLQYTELKDKNGNEIYEGDIVAGFDYYGEPLTWEVAWEWFDSETGFNIGQDDDAEAEIIGNIYENPELLEK